MNVRERARERWSCELCAATQPTECRINHPPATACLSILKKN